MTREWQPGDVAAVKSLGEERLCSWADDCPNVDRHVRGPHWHVLNSGRYIPGDRPGRPLVVIDPEDREAVERLAYGGAFNGKVRLAEQWQAALREFANPKPDEPQGLGAVVLDVADMRWTRSNEAGEWFSADGCDVEPWSNIAAVTVLSEGVR